ncbi:hypothetical protein [Kribbella sp. CA-247076]|uniref:WXG100-like domain-containing protein n=1 Tax=Kribbella sp. CA-247076 TaxID=3239941 RepID=UPI003D89BE72
MLWEWLQKFSDTYIWPRVDEDAAMRMGDNWNNVKLGMVASTDLANAANAQLPAVWKDATGGIFHGNIHDALNDDGYGSTVESFNQMAQMCWDLGRTVGQVKNQIYSELIVNAIFFAATFAMPPGIGDFFRWRLVANLATKFSTLIRGAAGLLEQAAPLTLPRSIGRLAAEAAWEGLEEVGTDLIAQNLDRQRGFRPEGIDWKQVGVSGGAGILGMPVSRGLNPVGRLGSAPAGRIADAFRLGDRGKTVLQQTGSAFVVNGVSSPITSTAAQSIADGNFWETLANPGAYAHAIVTGGLTAGVLGSSRIAAVHAGDYLGQQWSSTVREIRGMPPYIPPAGPDGPPASPATNPAAPTPATQNPAGQSPAGPNPVGSNPAGSNPAGSNPATTPAGSSSPATNPAASNQGGPGSDSGSSTGSGRPGTGSGGLSGSQASGTSSDTSASHPASQRTASADDATEHQRQPGHPSDDASQDEQQDTAADSPGRSTDPSDPSTQSDPDAITSTDPTAPTPTDPTASTDSTEVTNPSGPTEPGTAEHQIEQEQTTGSGAHPTTADLTPGSTTVGAAAQPAAGAAAQPTAGQPAAVESAAGRPTAAPPDAAARPTTQAPANAKPAKRAEAEAATDETEVDANRAKLLARGAEFAKLETTDFVPVVDGFHGPDSIVPPGAIPNSRPAGPNGPLVGAAVQVAPTALPQAANAAAPPPNRQDAGSSGPAHTLSSRASEPTTPESRTGPIDNDPPVPTGPPGAPDPTGEPEPEPQVVVSAAAIAAAGGSVHLAAQQELVARMNDRGPDGELTEAAERLRSEFYRTGAGKKRATGVLARRPLDAETPATGRTFVAEVGSARVSVPLPWVSQDKSAVLTLVAVHEGEKVRTTKVGFDDPVLHMTDATMIHLQQVVNAWSRSFGKPEVPMPTAEHGAEQAGSVPEAGRGHVGEEFARPFDRWLAARHPGDRIFRVSLQLDGAGSFDQVYVRLDADGAVTGFAIVEAKNPNADLNTRLGVDGETRYAQGHREYVRSILQAMTVLDRNERVAVLDAMDPVEVTLSADEYADAQATYHAAQRARAVDTAQVRYAEAAAEAVRQERTRQARSAIKAATEAARAAGADRLAARRAGEQALDRQFPTWKTERAAAFQAAFADFAAGEPARVAAAEAAALKAQADAAAAAAGADPSDAGAAEAAINARAEAEAAEERARSVAADVAFAADPEAAYQAEYEAAYRAARQRYVAGGGLPPWMVPARPLTNPEISSSFDLAEAMGRFLDDGTLEYFTVRAEVDGSTGLDRPKGIEITEYSMGVDPGGNESGPSTLPPPPPDPSDPPPPPAGPPEHGAAQGEQTGTAEVATTTRSFAGNEVTRPPGELTVGQSVVVELRSVLPELDPAVAQQVAEAAAREGKPLRDGRLVGGRFFGDAALGALGVPVDAAAFAVLENRLAELVRTGHQATLTITRVARPGSDSSPYRFTVEVRAGQQILAIHTSPHLAELAGRLNGGEQSPPGRQAWFLPGWLLVNLELPQVIHRPDVLAAAGIHEVDGGHGEYRVTNRHGTYRLFVRVRPLPVEITHETVSVPGASPVAWVTVSDQVATTELPRMMARILAQTAAATLDPSPAQLAEAADKPVFTPGSDPWADPRLEDTDHGDVAEVNQLAAEYRDAELARSWIRRRAAGRAMADLFVRMGLTKEQPDADLRRTLAPGTVRDLASRIEHRRSLTDNRLTRRAYLVRAVWTSTWSSVLVGAAAWTVTGDPLLALGMSLPTAAFGLAGAPMEHWLDGHKSAHKKPAYGADQARREQTYPGLRGAVDGRRPVREPIGKVPRTTGRPRYAVRYGVPLAAATLTAASLWVAGVPAFSTLWVLGATATVRTITERWIDAKKRDQRRARVDSNVLTELSNPGSAQNQLIRVLREQQERLDTLRSTLGLPAATTGRITTPRTPARHEIRSPGTPPYRVHLGQQVFDNDAAASARSLNPRLAPNDFDPTEVARQLSAMTEAIIAPFGPAAGGALLGSLGDKLFMSVEERLHDLQKNWDYAHREAIRGQALIDAMAQPLDLLHETLQDLARLAGADRPAPDLTDRTADRRTLLTPPEAAQSSRPYRGVSVWLYEFQVFLAAAGTAGSVLALDAVLGLNPLTVWTTVAAAFGAFSTSPVARMLFRRAELERKDANARALNKQGVDRPQLTEQVAIGKYLVAQLLDQIDQIRQDLRTAGESQVVVSPADADYTDRVRAAVELAHRDEVVAGPDATVDDLEVRRRRLAALTSIDRIAADVDRADATDPRGPGAARQRERLADAVSRYESVAAVDGATKPFPELASVSPARGRRVTGGPTDQIRAGAARALGRMLGEPGDKPLLVERLAALEAIVAAAEALDVHAEYGSTQVGTEDSYAFLFEQLTTRITKYNDLLDQANIIGGFPLPAISPSAPPAAVVHAPEIRRTGFVADGRTGVVLTEAEALAAVRESRVADFGGLVSADPVTVTVAEGRHGETELVIVTTPTGRHHFRVQIGSIQEGRMAATQLRAGTTREPHLVTFPPGIAADQLTRVWVHEISHTLQELNSRRGGPLQRLRPRLTGPGHDACVDAQLNEFRYLLRQLSLAEAHGERTRRDRLREDLEGLADAIRLRGRTPPALPWHAPPTGTSGSDPRTAITTQVQMLTEATDRLQALIDARNAKAVEADVAGREAEEKAANSRDARDDARHARRLAALAEVRKQADLAAWNRQLIAGYQRALAEAATARDGYTQLLADVDSSTPDHVAAELSRLAAGVAAYEQSLKALAPAGVLAGMKPTGSLPHLAALAERINAALEEHGIDERFSTRRLQQRLNAEFAGLGTSEGLVVRVGRQKTADLRIRLSVEALTEVVDPPAKHSETIDGLFPQPARRLGTMSTGRLGTAFTLPANALLRQVADVTGHGWLADVTVKRAWNVGRSRALTANAAEFANYGAVEDMRGEGVLFSGKASWQIDVRTDRATGWSEADKIVSGNQQDSGELHAWVSHAYTVGASGERVQRPDLRTGRLPDHVLTSIDGLEKLTDDVIATNGERLDRLGRDRRLVEDQIHAVLTKDLPGRLAESTGHAIVRPLMAGGQPIGHLEVATEIQYEAVELVGTSTTTHWQESVRIGFSNAAVVQNFGAGRAESTTLGYGGDQLTDLDDSGTDAGPSVSAGRSLSRAESLSGGGTAIHVGVHRFTGPTQGYRMVLQHTVKVVLDGAAVQTTSGESEILARVRVNDAYRHGLPVPRSEVLDAGKAVVRGDVQPTAAVPGRRLALPGWSVDGNGRLRAAGPWNIQGVTGREQALRETIARLAEQGFVPPLDSNGNPDLTELSPDPVERLGQLLNLEELRAQFSAERLEAGYDIAARGGIVVTLTRPRTGRQTETISLRIGVDQGKPVPVGVTDDEVVVLLNIGSETAGRAGVRSKAKPWRVDPFALRSGAVPDDQESIGLSYGRQALGRSLAWFTGGTINGVTLVESTSPVAVFTVPITLTVTALTPSGPELVHEGTESARLLIDSDFLEYADPTVTVQLSSAPGTEPLPDQVLDRATLLALGETDFDAAVPSAIMAEPTAWQQLSAFLNPRNLLAHPEWARATYRTTLLVSGPGGIARKVPLALTGRIRDAVLVSVTEGVVGDINFALGNHGTASGRSAGGSVEGYAGAKEDSVGGRVKASLGRNAADSHLGQTIWGVERLTIETGRQYVFTATAELDLAVGNDGPARSESAAVFQVPERDALGFYATNELRLPLYQVADAVERLLHGDLSLDRRTAAGVIRRYRADAAAAAAAGVPIPSLASAHTAQDLVAWLPPGPARMQTSAEERLEAALVSTESVRNIDLPAHYQEHLGSSLVESVDLTSARIEDEAGGNSHRGEGIRVLSEVHDVLRRQLGTDPEQDPVLAASLFADLAGKRWWGRLEDMLGPTGFVRSYPVGRPGDLTARQVSVRIHAEFTGLPDDLGEVKDLVSIIQRYLYEERSRTVGRGRSSGLGLDGTPGAGSPADGNPDTGFDPGRSGSVGTDRAEGTSTTEAEQLTRLERMATFDGLTRIARNLRLTVHVGVDSAAPTRGLVARGLAPEGSVVEAPARIIEGTLVQLIPTDVIRSAAAPSGTASQPAATGQAAVPEAAVPEAGPALELPATYTVEGTGQGRFRRPDLLSVVEAELARNEFLGPVGVRMHHATLQNRLSASARNATFSRMASDGGFRLDPLQVAGHRQQNVHVGVTARVSVLEVVAGPFEGELGDINRSQHTVSTGTTSGRLLPVVGSETLTAADDIGGTVDVGEQLTDTTTDVRGSRRERTRSEKGSLVTVRVRVDYDLDLTRTRIRQDGSERVVKHHVVPGATTGEAFLTMHEHEYLVLLAQERGIVRSPQIPGTRYVADGREPDRTPFTREQALEQALYTTTLDYGGLLTEAPALSADGRHLVVTQGDVEQHFRVEIGDADRGMAFTELHAGTEADPHVVTFAAGMASHQLARVWVHEISHTLQELAAEGVAGLRQLTGALTTNGENACVDAQYNEFRFLVRLWYEAVASGWGSVHDVKRDAEGLARAMEGRGYPPPAIPWLTGEEIDALYDVRADQVTARDPLPPDGRRPRAFLLYGPPGADLRTTRERLFAASRPEDLASYRSEDDFAAHPRFEAIMREWGVNATALIAQALPPDLASTCLEQVIEGDPGYDVVVSDPVGLLPETLARLRILEDHDCRVSVVCVVTNGADSLLATADEYQHARDTGERGGLWFGTELHDLVAAELPNTLLALQAGEYPVDDLYLVTSDGHVLYENHQDGDGHWEHDAAVSEAYVAERDRPPTPLERARAEAIAEWLLHGREGLAPLEREVEETVATAVGRERNRPEPQPRGGQFGDEDDEEDLENRLHGNGDPRDRDYRNERRHRPDDDDLAFSDE